MFKKIESGNIDISEDPQEIKLSFECENDSNSYDFLLRTMDAPMVAASLLYRAQDSAKELSAMTEEEFVDEFEKNDHVMSSEPIKANDIEFLFDGLFCLHIGFAKLHFRAHGPLRELFDDLRRRSLS